MILRGPVAWCKVLGKPQDGYTEGDKEWSFDFGVTEEGKARYLKEGGSEFYLKTKENHPIDGEFIAFKRREIGREGNPNKPITVVDRAGKPWDPSVKIGNGSICNVKFALNEVKAGKDVRLKPSVISIQVVEHVPYEGSGDGDYEEFPIYDDENWENTEND